MARARKLLNLLIAFVIIIFQSSLLFLHVVVATVVAAVVVAADHVTRQIQSWFRNNILSNFFTKLHFLLHYLHFDKQN